MKINLAKSAGFCFGVKNALTKALETAKVHKPVFMLGDIVHNEDVVKQIQDAGIKKIRRLGNGTNKTLIIRAHGCSKNTLDQAIKSGYRVVDATCPMVKEIHRIAQKLEDDGYRLIIIGDSRHDEVLGIVGQLKTKAIIIESIRDIPLEKIKKIPKAAIVVQSTQNLDKVTPILKLLRKHIPEINFQNTICQPTRIKQSEVKTMPLANSVMIIIGSKTSANTKRIYQISKSLNKKTYWVSAPGQIKKCWLAKAKNVGISAGASTPQSSIQAVIVKIKTLYPA
jgi:4-hydroxy-3-methylbut-2-en-1-yl diphosphate reductase